MLGKLLKSGLIQMSSEDVRKRTSSTPLYGLNESLNKLYSFCSIFMSSANQDEQNTITKLDFIPTILLNGSPNTGKTTLCLHLFNKLKQKNNEIDLFFLDASSLVDPELGATSRNLTAIFSHFHTRTWDKPAVLILDEIDQFCMSRNNKSEHDAIRRTMSTLMLELDNLHPSISEGVIIIGITNVVSLIDTAIVRRFSLKLDIYSKLEKREFKKTISELSKFIDEQVDIEFLEDIYKVYSERSISIADIKGYFRMAYLEKRSVDNFNFNNYILEEFKNGYSSIK